MIQDLLLNALILIAFTSVGQQLIKDKTMDYTKSSLRTKMIIGIVFGILACILMTYGSKTDNKTIVGIRNISIIMSAIYGGVLPSIITALIAGIFRISVFGVHLASITSFLTAVIVSVGCSFIVTRIEHTKKRWELCTLFNIIVVSLSYMILIQDTVKLVVTIGYYCSLFIIMSVFEYNYIEYLKKTTMAYQEFKRGYSVDYLTGLCNVRSFQHEFKKVIGNSLHKGEEVSLIVIDIDDFKMINDKYGHTNGDTILEQFAQVLKHSCDPNSVIARNGGEEFSIILKNTTYDKALQIGEIIRNNIHEHQFKMLNGEILSISVSIGVSNYPKTTFELHRLYKDADKAMYIAKRNGKNRVQLANNNYEEGNKSFD